MKKSEKFLLILLTLFSIFLVFSCNIGLTITQVKNDLIGTWETEITSGDSVKWKEELTFCKDSTIVHRKIKLESGLIEESSGTYSIYINPKEKMNFKGVLILKFENDSKSSMENHYYFGFYNKQLQIVEKYGDAIGLTYQKIEAE